MSRKNVPPQRISQIQDPEARKNFQELVEFFRQNSPLLGFRMIDLTFTQAEENYRFRHGLGIVPQDILVTFFVGPGTLTWNYNSFDSEFLDITVTGECRVRALIGSYRESP
jgi:hypothetical protein